ncbi:MAG: hypothetical protein DBY36_08950 [Clostridiales bacterium]|nr:MAG: hypothetical protein DBY36_08950 [Clostridiales bacterium]
MTKRLTKYAPMLVFCAFIAVCFLVNLIKPDAEISELENRELAQRPELTLKTFFSGKFMQDYEAYITDQFFARDTWVTAKACAELALLKTDINGVLIGSDGLLVQQFAAPDAERVRANASFVEAFAASAGVPVYFTVIPSAAALWGDRLPANAQNADQQALIEEIFSLVPSAHTIDACAALSAHVDEPIYFQTDHHWTSLGAYYGYTAACEAMGLDAAPLGAPFLSESGFFGTASSACGLRPGEGDSVELYVPAENAAAVTVYEGSGERAAALYDMDAFRKSDKYAVFLGGNYPRVVIRSAVSDGGRLLYIKDSYANACAPFFTENFSEIHMIDLRYYKKSVADYIRDNKIDAVFVAYSAANFVSDTNMMFMTK